MSTWRGAARRGVGGWEWLTDPTVRRLRGSVKRQFLESARLAVRGISKVVRVSLFG